MSPLEKLREKERELFNRARSAKPGKKRDRLCHAWRATWDAVYAEEKREAAASLGPWAVVVEDVAAAPGDLAL